MTRMVCTSKGYFIKGLADGCLAEMTDFRADHTQPISGMAWDASSQFDPSEAVIVAGLYHKAQGLLH